jgi:hypothetical protein
MVSASLNPLMRRCVAFNVLEYVQRNDVYAVLAALCCHTLERAFACAHGVGVAAAHLWGFGAGVRCAVCRGWRPTACCYACSGTKETVCLAVC